MLKLLIEEGLHIANAALIQHFMESRKFTQGQINLLRDYGNDLSSKKVNELKKQIEELNQAENIASYEINCLRKITDVIINEHKAKQKSKDISHPITILK